MRIYFENTNLNPETKELASPRGGDCSLRACLTPELSDVKQLTFQKEQGMIIVNADGNPFFTTKNCRLIEVHLRSNTTIGEGAFAYCSCLTKVVLPRYLKEIGDRAFMSCSSLTTMKIPFGVKKIGKYAFVDCSALRQIDIPASVTEIRQEAFKRCPCLKITCANDKQAKLIRQSGFQGVILVREKSVAKQEFLSQNKVKQLG